MGLQYTRLGCWHKGSASDLSKRQKQMHKALKMVYPESREIHPNLVLDETGDWVRGAKGRHPRPRNV